MIGMMWFKRDSKPVEKPVDKIENGMVGRLRRKKPVLLKSTRESSERETSTESEKEKRRYSDILDIKVSQGKCFLLDYLKCWQISFGTFFGTFVYRWQHIDGFISKVYGLHYCCL